MSSSGQSRITALSRFLRISATQDRLRAVVAEVPLQARLASLCARPANPGAARVSDLQVQQIQTLLEITDKETKPGRGWRWRPRIYAILVNIGGLHFMEDFVKSGISDFYLPFTEQTLPSFVTEATGADYRQLFFDAQDYFLTDLKDLETGTARHMYIDGDGDRFFQPVQHLGRGGFGSVDQVCSMLSYRNFARKRVLRARDPTSRIAQEYLIKELSHLRRLKHEHLVQTIGSYTDNNYIAYIMLPVAETNLEDFLGRNKVLNDRQAKMLREFYGCLAGAVHYLHTQKIRHRDLSGRNVLIHHNKVCISDFGSAYDFANRSTSMTRHRSTPVSPSYMAPEIAKGEDRDSTSDMWSLGVLFLEMTTKLRGRQIGDLRKAILDHAKTRSGQQPYLYCNTPVISTWLGVLRDSESTNEFDNEPLEWIMNLLRAQPSKRLSARLLMKDILESPSFSSFCCAKCERDFRDSGFAYDSAVSAASRSLDIEDAQQVMATLAAAFDSEGVPSGFGSQAVEKSTSIENWIHTGFTRGHTSEVSAAQPDIDVQNELPVVETSIFPAAVPYRYGDWDTHGQSAMPQPAAKQSGHEKGVWYPDLVAEAHWSLQPRPEPQYTPKTPGGWPEDDDDDGIEREATSYQPVNVRDSGLGFDEYDSGGSDKEDDEVEDGRLFDEIADGDSSDAESIATIVPGHDHLGGLETIVEGDESSLPAHLTLKPDITAEASHIFDEVLSDDEDDEPSAVEHPTPAKIEVLASRIPEQVAELISSASGVSPLSDALTLATPSLAAVVQVCVKIAENPEIKPAPASSVGLLPRSNYRSPFVEEVKDDLELGSHESSQKLQQADLFSPSSVDLAEQLASDSSKPEVTITRATFGRSLVLERQQIVLTDDRFPEPLVSAANHLDGGEVSRNSGEDQASGLSPGRAAHAEQTSKLSAANLNAHNWGISIDRVPAEDQNGQKQQPKARVTIDNLNLESFLRNTWESASSAPTSVVSQRTRARIENSLLPYRSLDASLGLLSQYCREGKPSAVKLLLSRGCNPGTKKTPHPGPILASSRGGTRGHFKCIKLLIDAGANVNVKRKTTGKTPLHFAIEHDKYSHYEKLIWLLVNAGADTNVADLNGETPLEKLLSGSDSLPLEQHRLRALAIIINSDKAHVDPKLPGTGNTPLHLAVRRQDKWAVAMLLFKGSNVNAMNHSGTTPLQLTANQFRGELNPDHALVLKLLLEADKKARDDFPLLHAKEPKMIDYQVGVQRRTALHHAVASGTVQAVEMLLEYGASPEIQDATGKTAKDIAVELLQNEDEAKIGDRVEVESLIKGR